MQRECLKCGHVNANATGTELEACPQCGAIYSRVAAALAAHGSVRTVVRPTAAPEPPAPTPSHAARAAPAPVPHRADFIAHLRGHSHYPAFRAAVRFCEFLGYAAAVGLAILAGLAIKNGGIASGASFMFSAFWVAIGARVLKELFSMLADGVDAAVHMAARVSAMAPDESA